MIDSEVCKEGRFVFMNILVDNNTYTLVNVYANNDKNNRNNFFQNINKLIADKAQGLKIIGGDMNDKLEKLID